MEAERNTTLLSFIAIVVFSLLQTQSFARQKSYIIYLGGHSHGAEATLEHYETARTSHYNLLSSFLGSEEKARAAIFYSYTKYINGFAANLEEDEVQEISRHPQVLSVFENEAKQLHTTRAWEIEGLEVNGRVPKASLWAKARFGEDTIIATLDTGVWPESKSFNDEGMGPVPSRWKGSCPDNTKDGVRCNRKLIGAKYFNQGAAYGQQDGTIGGTARDTEGHGTHTLSTAGGGFVPGANIFGFANGTAKGGSPHARVAAYKVCWTGGCYSADILAGFDEAIHDGVDVISLSVGGTSSDFLSDPIAVGSFHAVSQGIIVVCSAGNSGPTAGSVTNVAPWILTVGASTIDREFPAILTLGNKKQIKGQSLSQDALQNNKLYPVINGRDAKAANASGYEAHYCYLNSLDPKQVKGKIVVCVRGGVGRVETGESVLLAGGAGLILVNDESSGNSIIADPHLLPATNIAYSDGKVLRHYMNSTKSPVATISPPTTQLGVKPTPFMAAFSSQGPSLITPQILKPDITAPGVSILAAYTEATSPTALPYDTRRVQFDLMSGTSMSCPHVSGVAGLLKTLHPDWSHAAIRSAIMTTARTRDNTGSPMKDYTFTKATPLAYGSGHIRPNRAMDPGLIYNLTIDNYMDFLCAQGYDSSALVVFSNKTYSCPAKPITIEDMNYPSIAVPNLEGSMVVTRTVTNVGGPGTYRARVKAPFGITVSVKPSVLQFQKAGEEKTFTISFKSRTESVGVGYVFGMLIWSDGKHYVRSPLVVNAAS